MNKPILLICFNRPDLTKRQLNILSHIKPERFYVACDAPRSHVADDKRLVQEVKDLIAGLVTWPCELKTFYHEVNQGCKLGVSGAISWFLSHEEAGIILEDDCIPCDYFFTFVSTLLDQYRDDERIMAIGGTNPRPLSSENSQPYFFSWYGSIWGWATWRRSWQLMDLQMRGWPSFSSMRQVFKRSTNILEFICFCLYFTQVKLGLIDTWDYQWLFTCLTNGMTIIPRINLIENSGFNRSDATHTQGACSYGSLKAGANIHLNLDQPPPKNDPIQFDRELWDTTYPTFRSKIKLFLSCCFFAVRMLKQFTNPDRPRN